MYEHYKILGQQAPNAITEATLYTVTASHHAVISALIVTNRGSDQGTIRISIALAGAVTENKQYIAYDETIEANSSVPYAKGITLAATDVVRIYASSADFTFSLFGVEADD